MTFANAIKEELKNNIFSYLGVLQGVELESGEIDVSGFIRLTVVIDTTLVSDYITLYVKNADDGEWIPVTVDDSGTQIKTKEIYSCSLDGIKAIKFERTGVADGARSLDISLVNPII